MIDRNFIDTNILVYLYSVDEPTKSNIAKDIFARGNSIISTQVLNEFSNILIKKYKQNAINIIQAINEIEKIVYVATISNETIKLALNLKSVYGYSYYDSLIIASALETECNILITEDLHSNHLIENRLFIKNPFE